MNVSFWNGKNWENVDHDGRIAIDIGDQKFTLEEYREMLSVYSNCCKISIEVENKNTVLVQDRYVNKSKTS